VWGRMLEATQDAMRLTTAGRLPVGLVCLWLPVHQVVHPLQSQHIIGHNPAVVTGELPTTCKGWCDRM
jgi:hypothetical protein